MLARLRPITAELAELAHDPAAQYEEFEQRRSRSLSLPPALLREGIAGRAVLVTGGSGCIGSALLRELELLQPGRVVSISRTPSGSASASPAVEYRRCDILDREALSAVFRDAAPDVVFHLAAQRDPGLAERTVAESILTNAIGTSNVVDAAERQGVGSFVYASTGKALRPYTPHIYAATKKLGELLTLAAANRGGLGRCAVARFTHVVDNSIVLRRFRAATNREALHLHDPATMFYTQSAREAAQLLLWSNWNAGRRPTVELAAIRDLGMPAKLLDVALGVVASGRGAQAIYLRGYEPGYEDSYYPGLYDPQTAADVSPLLNAFEAGEARHDSGIDACELGWAQQPERVPELLRELESACERRAGAPLLRALLDELSLLLLELTLAGADPDVLGRLARLTAPARATMSETDLVIDDGIRARVGGGPSTADGRR